MNRSACTVGTFDRDLDTRADRGSIRPYANELDPEPVVTVARVLEQPERVCIAGRGAADLEDDLLVAVVIEIGERDAMSLVHLARTGRDGHVDERLAALVP